MSREDIIRKLNENKDLKYKEFNDKIINTSKKTIGVRTNIIKKIAKKIYKDNYDIQFKDEYYEEILLEGFIISYIDNANLLLSKLDEFIDKIDNWAICDLVNSNCKILKKDENKQKTIKFINKNIKSNNIWKVRFSYVLLLNYFISDKYLDMIFKLLEEDNNSSYYVMMAKAWLISICFIKHSNETMLFLKNTKIDDITYNKSLSKICDSTKVDKNTKIIIKNMKRKNK